MNFKITINDASKIYTGIMETVQGINDTLFELTGKRKDNLDSTINELLTADTFKDILYSRGIKIPGTRVGDKILVINVQAIS